MRPGVPSLAGCESLLGFWSLPHSLVVGQGPLIHQRSSLFVNSTTRPTAHGDAGRSDASSLGRQARTGKTDNGQLPVPRQALPTPYVSSFASGAKSSRRKATYLTPAPAPAVIAAHSTALSTGNDDFNA